MKDTEITTTPEHPFYVPQKGWTGAIHLRAGNMLVLSNSEYKVFAGSLNKSAHQFVRQNLSKIAEGIRRFYYV